MATCYHCFNASPSLFPTSLQWGYNSGRAIVCLAEQHRTQPAALTARTVAVPIERKKPEVNRSTWCRENCPKPLWVKNASIFFRQSRRLTVPSPWRACLCVTRSSCLTRQRKRAAEQRDRLPGYQGARGTLCERKVCLRASALVDLCIGRRVGARCVCGHARMGHKTHPRAA